MGWRNIPTSLRRGAGMCCGFSPVPLVCLLVIQCCQASGTGEVALGPWPGSHWQLTPRSLSSSMHHPGAFFPTLFSLFPLSYSLVDQLLNPFHPCAELPEVSWFKLNTFLFESTRVPGKCLALQMSSFECWRCTWSLPACFSLVLIISHLIPLCSRFNLSPQQCPVHWFTWIISKRAY